MRLKEIVAAVSFAGTSAGCIRQKPGCIPLCGIRFLALKAGYRYSMLRWQQRLPVRSLPAGALETSQAENTHFRLGAFKIKVSLEHHVHYITLHGHCL